MVTRASTPSNEPKGELWWSLKPVVRAGLPEGPETNPIDRFLNAELRKRGLKAVGPADKISLLRRVYAAIVIDMSSHLNDINLAFLDASDAIIEIVTYDSTTIHNTVAMADTFRSIGYPASKVRYLVNRADSAGGIDPQDLERALGRVPEHQVQSDGRLVIQSNNEGVPFVLASPEAQISKDVMRIAGELLNAGRVTAMAGRS